MALWYGMITWAAWLMKRFFSIRRPFFFSSSISVISASGSITTPFPITHWVPAYRTPEGIRWKTYVRKPLTTV